MFVASTGRIGKTGSEGTTTPSVFTDNPKLAEYNYTLRDDGKKESADEIIYATDGTTPVDVTKGATM